MQIGVASCINELQIKFSTFLGSFFCDAGCYKQGRGALPIWGALILDIPEDSESINALDFNCIWVALSVRFDFDNGIRRISLRVAWLRLNHLAMNACSPF